MVIITLFERANPQSNRITFVACTRKAAAALNRCPWKLIIMKTCFFQCWVINPITRRLFAFPKRKFGDKKPTYRSFQSSWFDKWPWITYETEDKAFCFVCIKAVQQERVRNCSLTSKTSDAFLTRGYTYWKDATGEKHGEFPLHERSHVSFYYYS